jgi:hypothetical protein
MREMIVYRIPSERHYSILKIKAIKFTPPAAGGIIRLPHAAITMAGFDFDIDKLYLMRKQFIEKQNDKYSDSLSNSKVWAKVYQMYPFLKEYLEGKRLKNEDLESHYDEVIEEYKDDPRIKLALAADPNYFNKSKVF